MNPLLLERFSMIFMLKDMGLNECKERNDKRSLAAIEIG
jgi:hypothetical protein